TLVFCGLDEGAIARAHHARRIAQRAAIGTHQTDGRACLARRPKRPFLSCPIALAVSVVSLSRAVPRLDRLTEMPAHQSRIRSTVSNRRLARLRRIGQCGISGWAIPVEANSRDSFMKSIDKRGEEESTWVQGRN